MNLNASRLTPPIVFGAKPPVGKIKAPPPEVYEKLKVIGARYPKLQEFQLILTYWQVQEEKASKGLSLDQLLAKVEDKLKKLKPDDSGILI
ncbi:MAG: hypothetical protein K2X66_12205 [Cyanobacteria bacterium]|nr:hypothetical protein [Cyanobacteriota bacterium]